MIRMSAQVADGVRHASFLHAALSREVIAKEIKQRETVRYRVAFYGSTPSYRPVLSLHGWDDLGAQLHLLSLKGRWKEMAAAISDDVLSAFVVQGTHAELAARLDERFAGLSDGIELGSSSNPMALPDELIQDLRAISGRRGPAMII
jgi:hypothetical protein